MFDTGYWILEYRIHWLETRTEALVDVKTGWGSVPWPLREFAI